MDLTTLSSNWKRLQSSTASSNITSSPATTKVPSHKPPTTHPQSNHALKRKRPGATNTALPPPRKRPHLSNNTSLPTPHKRTRHMKMSTSTPTTDPATSPLQPTTTSQINTGLSPTVQIGKYVSLDCEMVGVGPNGLESSLARVSIVNYDGVQIYDSFVSQKETVVDWRTPISGIKPSHMTHARSFETVQADVAAILEGRVVVGHALRHDFKALLLDHPERDVRDTSRYAAYKKLAGGTPKLQLLASELLGIEIQGGEHSSLEDARACMLLFRRDKDGFESKSKTRTKMKRVR